MVLKKALIINLKIWLKKMNKVLLLSDKYPIYFSAEIAKKIGLNEAIVLQQIHSWVLNNKKNNINFKDGYYWTYNSYKKWDKVFIFLSESTIIRTIKKLEKSNLLIVKNYNKMKGDRTRWYRVNLEALNDLTK